jgi:ATP-dependent 26S proteasome regulatory subunit
MNWRDFNFQYLNREISHLQQKIQQTIEPSEAEEPILEAPEIPQPKDISPPTLQSLCEEFGLSQLERDLLIMCVAAEIDFSFGQLLHQSLGNVQSPYPTIHTALTISSYPGIHIYNRNLPLFKWQIVDITSSGNLVTAPLKIKPWALQYLLGYDYEPPEYQGMLTPNRFTSPLRSIPSSYSDHADELYELWVDDEDDASTKTVQLCGPDPLANQHIASLASEQMGLVLYTIDLDALAQLKSDAISDWLMWWHRRALLQGHVLLVNCRDTSPPNPHKSTWIAELEKTLTTFLIFNSGERLPDIDIPTLDIKALTIIEQKHLWQTLLSETEADLDLEPLQTNIGSLVSQFNFNAPTIHSISRRTLSRIKRQNLVEPKEINDLLWKYCRTESRSSLEGLVERIEPKTTWDELILNEEATQVLHQIIATASSRDEVYSQWKMGGNTQRGMGVTSIFFGPPGTGKTTAAEIIAHELELDLYRVDLSQVSDKYIGETEKKLKKVFDEAEKSGALLLFDEADALIGKRTDVKDSKDRYANQSVSYLLQRMEAYSGLAILTTNLPNAIDPAFMRRIRFHVRFEYPTLEQRFEIWKRQFPGEAPIYGLSFQRLAQLNVPGAIIRNIALGGAFLASREGRQQGKEVPIQMRHLLQAARAECIKQGRPITDEEIRGWV